jgi:pyruvate dehydrogenase E2 component (dihydrolipoamide acetyltransferase)/2-oxoglutarate dehydrogenase E2 component (dihydrolipoamide succinyltransferase)
VAPAPAPDGRILVSPKARRLAAEEGLDLRHLVAAGHPQPFHVTDLETLRTLSVTEVEAGILPDLVPPAAPVRAACQIGARVPLAATHDFLTRMEAEAGITLSPDALWVRFAAEAYRAATDAAEIIVEVAALGAESRRIANPDRARLSAQPADMTGRPAALILRDLTASPITTMRVGTGAAPTLGIGKDGESYAVTLDYTDGQLSEDAAISFITGFAKRLSEPLLHLI